MLQESRVEEHCDEEQPLTSFSSLGVFEPPNKKRKKGQGTSAKQDELLQVACNFLKSKQKPPPLDDCDLIGNLWAVKLRAMSPLDRKTVEKKVNDFIAEVDIERLSVNPLCIDIPRQTQRTISGSSTVSASSMTNILCQEDSIECVATFFSNYNDD
ncbi:unnamed protein product [Nezara viridula]|uniref:Uncharacterized protein n=1 Tax=Nezara viridula TaxID=85310 RepID=A0A9P0H430_NEZVI|nr:unnamed protein product [Nezara viridula]